MAPFPAGIYALLDGDRLGWRTPTRVQTAVAVDYARAAEDAGASVLQLRCKSLAGSGDRVRDLALAIRAAVRIPLVLNDDAALAAALGVGLHLGQDDGDPRLVRAPLLGWSTHTLAQVAQAQALPVDYLGFGPVRATTGKQAADPVTGWALLQQAVANSRLPVVAIGGLELGDMATVRATGAHAAAVIGAWLGPVGQPHSPAAAGRALAALHRAWHG